MTLLWGRCFRIKQSRFFYYNYPRNIRKLTLINWSEGQYLKFSPILNFWNNSPQLQAPSLIQDNLYVFCPSQRRYRRQHGSMRVWRRSCSTTRSTRRSRPHPPSDDAGPASRSLRRARRPTKNWTGEHGV